MHETAAEKQKPGIKVEREKKGEHFGGCRDQKKETPPRVAGVGAAPAACFSAVPAIHHHYHGYSADLIRFKIICQFSFGRPRHFARL